MSKKNKGGKKPSQKTQAAVAEEAKKTVKTQQKPATSTETKPEEKPVEQKPTEKPQNKKPQEKKIPTPPEEAPSIDNGGVSVEKPNEKKPEQKENHEQREESDASLIGKVMSRNSGTVLSQDGKVRFLDLLDRAFVTPTSTAYTTTAAVQKEMAYAVQVGLIGVMADEAVNGDSNFSMLISKKVYPRLAETAKGLGVTLPSIKALEAHTSTENKKAGNLEVPVGKGSGTKVSKETAEQIKHEKTIQDSEPELDPEQIKSEEELKKALEYLLTVKNRSIGLKLTTTLDFIKKYRFHEAQSKENKDELFEKLKLRSTADWLTDVFSYVDRPGFIFKGIGKGMCESIDTNQNVINAFLILKNTIVKADGKWSDQDIADATKCIVIWVSRLTGKDIKNSIEALGDSKKLSNEDKLKLAKDKADLEKIDKRIELVSNPGSEYPESFLQKLAEHDGDSIGNFALLRRIYYPETVATYEVHKEPIYETKKVKDENGKEIEQQVKVGEKDVETKVEKHYKNIKQLIEQRIGIITNLFRDAASPIQSYSTDNLTDPVEYTEEEWKAKQEADAKAKEEEEAAKK